MTSIRENVGESIPVCFLFTLLPLLLLLLVFEVRLLFDLRVAKVINGVSAILSFLQEGIENLTDVIRVTLRCTFFVVIEGILEVRNVEDSSVLGVSMMSSGVVEVVLIVLLLGVSCCGQLLFHLLLFLGPSFSVTAAKDTGRASQIVRLSMRSYY